MKIHLLRFSLIPVLAAFGMAAQASNSTQTDAAFLQKAAMGNLTEIELGKMGAQKAQNADLKQFCHHLQQDHAQANLQLDALAKNKGVTLPTKLDARHQKEVQNMQKMSGADFDKNFTTALVRDHARTITFYQHEVTSAKDPAVKSFAQNSIPKFQQHLQESEKIAKEVGVSDQTVSSILKRYPGATGAPGAPTGRY